MDAVKLRRAVGKARSNGARVVIFDRYIFDQLATLPLEHPLTRAYVRMLVKIVPKPDVAYLLDAIPEAALERKPEYPLDFLHKYRDSYLCLRDLAGLTLIDPLPQNDVHLAITRELEKCRGLDSAELGCTPMSAQ
jgi:thymidylate kinase